MSHHHSSIQSESKKAYSVPKNWTKVDDVHSNDLIEAYLKGVEHGKGEMSRILMSQFRDNLKNATLLCEQLLDIANKEDIKLQRIHLKADGITNFTALFIADLNDFVSDNFRNLYKIARQIKIDSIRENFYISFSFMPNSSNLNQHCLSSDGFFMTYDKRPRATPAR